MLTGLVVEDDPSIQHLIVELLREQGFDRVLVARDGEDALAQACACSLDLVVLDPGLGNSSGVEVAHRLKALPGFETPILVTTALPRQQAEHACAEAGACECVSKPFDITEFLRAVQRCTDGEAAVTA